MNTIGQNEHYIIRYLCSECSHELRPITLKYPLDQPLFFCGNKECKKFALVTVAAKKEDLTSFFSTLSKSLPSRKRLKLHL